MKEIEAYVRGQCSQAMPNPKHWYFFGSTKQFNTCQSFLMHLKAKHPSYEFITRVVK